VREDTWQRLCGDGKLVQLVKAQIDARGGFVSPLVKSFLRFCYGWVVKKARELSEKGRFDREFAHERLQNVIGRAEADHLRVLPYHEIVMLGRVVRGELSPNPDDPERTAGSFQVDPATDLSRIVLREVRGRLQRTRLNAAARASFRENIKRIRYVDEAG
jgi:hypothetical protein